MRRIILVALALFSLVLIGCSENTLSQEPKIDHLTLEDYQPREISSQLAKEMEECATLPWIKSYACGGTVSNCLSSHPRRECILKLAEKSPEVCYHLNNTQYVSPQYFIDCPYNADYLPVDCPYPSVEEQCFLSAALATKNVNLCPRQKTVLLGFCVGTIFNFSMESCEGLSDQVARDTCYTLGGITKQDYSYCRRVSPQLDTFETISSTFSINCYQFVFLKIFRHKTPSYCSTIDDNIARDYCWYYAALNTRKQNHCDNIKTNELETACREIFNLE